MIAVPALFAPEETITVISRYRGRWVYLPALMLSGLWVAFVWWVPLEDPHPLLFRLVSTAVLLTFLVGWWLFTWGLPARKYRRFRAMEHIVEIRNPDIIAFAKGYWEPVNKHIEAIREAEGKRQIAVLLEMHELSGYRAALLALVAAEQDRLKNLSHP